MSKKSMKQFNERKTAQKPIQNTQPKKVKKREVEAWILAIFMIAWTVCSVLGTIGFCRTQASADSVEIASIEEEMAVEYSTAYNSKRIRSNADVSTDFYSFNIDLFSSMVFFNDSLTACWFTGSWDLEFNYLSATLLYHDNDGDVTFDLFDTSIESINYFAFDAVSVDGVYHTGSVEVSGWNSSYSNPNREPLYVIPDLRSFYPRSYSLIPVGYDISLDALGSTAFEVGIEFYNSVSAVSQYIYILIDTNFVESFACYYTSRGLTDTDDFGFVPIYGASFGNVDFQNGYNAGYNDGLSYGQNIGEQLGFDNGFTEGVRDGREQGYIEGRDLGYDEGYSNGRQQGYNEGRADGFTQGVADANEYTFAGLIGAVFDAPIQAFQGLFSFEVLGVDLSGFLLSLLTCGIALCVIKLII